jgi:hypothetical protein
MLWRSQLDAVECFAAPLAAAALGELGAGGGIDRARDGLGDGGDEVTEAPAGLNHGAVGVEEIALLYLEHTILVRHCFSRDGIAKSLAVLAPQRLELSSADTYNALG